MGKIGGKVSATNFMGFYKNVKKHNILRILDMAMYGYCGIARGGV
jgi:hypothetical protein